MGERERNRPYIIGLTGGMGAGKSVVSRILRCRGYEVYDCDAEAKGLMETSDELILSIRNRFGQDCYDFKGRLNRAYIARKIFSSDTDLRWLNSIVHQAVRRDIEKWSERKDIAFVESAILHTSKLDLACDEIWIVDADEELRLNRVLNRGGIGRDDAIARINSQKGELEELEGERISRIDNSGNRSLLIQIDSLLKKI